MYLRRETQTFHLLPVSGLIVFGVRTYMQRLDTLSYYEIVDVQTLVNKWKDDVAIYHERDTWLPVIDKHIKEMEVYHRKINKINGHRLMVDLSSSKRFVSIRIRLAVNCN